MTREEAIERLRKMLTEAVEFEDSVCYVAEEDREREPLEMAIKALEQEPILDKIRAEIIEMRSKQNVGVLECLDIIDKYKAESEDKE